MRRNAKAHGPIVWKSQRWFPTDPSRATSASKRRLQIHGAPVSLIVWFSTTRTSTLYARTTAFSSQAITQSMPDINVASNF